MTRVRAVPVVLLAGLFMAGCAGGPAAGPADQSGSAPPRAPLWPPSPAPPGLDGPASTAVISAGSGVLITVADREATIVARAGQVIRVQLDPTGLPEQEDWTALVVSGASVAVERESGGYPGTDPLEAELIARSPGDATVESTSDEACLHATPACLPPQATWHVTVHVVGGESSSGASKSKSAAARRPRPITPGPAAGAAARVTGGFPG